MSNRLAIIAIDGPAASGKSTIGHALAEKLNYFFFDTGIMYRAVTRAVLDQGLNPDDEDAVTTLARGLEIDIRLPRAEEQDGRQATVLINGQDQTWSIRAPQIDQTISLIAAYPGVRAALNPKQRAIGIRYGAGRGDKAGVIMVGRDIGTVVFPDAPLKIYLNASPEERAERRLAQQAERAEPGDYGQILRDMVRRDERDSGRIHAPMRPADDALIVDTSHMLPDEVLDYLMALAAGQPAAEIPQSG